MRLSYGWGDEVKTFKTKVFGYSNFWKSGGS
jgi:hypothetical protein